MSGLESRELLAPAPTAVVRVGPFPKAPPGDFGTVSQPTLVQHPDVPAFYIPLWDSSREYSYGSSSRERFFLIRNPGSSKLAFFVHGGGFVGSSATEAIYYPLLEKLWNEGYSIAAIEYPLLTESKWPGPVRSIAGGLIAANGLMGSTITHRVIVGVSAGASAGALILYSPDRTYPTLPFRVDAFIGASGIYVVPWLGPLPGPVGPGRLIPDALQKAFKGSPKTRTPAFLVAGDHDPVDPGAGTPNSDLLGFARYLIRGGIHVVAQITTGADGDHKGPYRAFGNYRLDKFYTLALR